MASELGRIEIDAEPVLNNGSEKALFWIRTEDPNDAGQQYACSVDRPFSEIYEIYAHRAGLPRFQVRLIYLGKLINYRTRPRDMYFVGGETVIAHHLQNPIPMDNEYEEGDDYAESSYRPRLIFVEVQQSRKNPLTRAFGFTYDARVENIACRWAQCLGLNRNMIRLVHEDREVDYALTLEEAGNKDGDRLFSLLY